MFGIVDHAVAWAEFARQVGWEHLRGDDERPDGNDLFSQRGGGFGSVRAAGEDDFPSPHCVPGSADTKPAYGVLGFGFDFFDARVVVQASACAPRGMSQSDNVARGI